MDLRMGIVYERVVDRESIVFKLHREYKQVPH
jgi:hypothetical protein